MRFILAVAALSLTGCVSSGASLQQSKVEKTWTGAASPQKAATCFAESVNGSVDLRNDGPHYWVIRNSTYGPMVRYDFHPADNGGSMVERRSGFNWQGAADDKLEACLN